jgi:plasmid stabilization system protein ParE
VNEPFRIVWTDTASNDLLAIVDYIALRDSVDAAADVHERIMGAVDDLETTPRRCRICWRVHGSAAMVAVPHLWRGEWMPLFMIERRYADELEVTLEVAAGINRVNEDEGVRWLYSFLSADKRKTYCLYEAPSADAIRRAAVRAGIPADEITEVSGRVMPDATLDEASVW